MTAALSACADDVEIIDPGMGQVRGRDRFREYLETFKRAMPDARAIVEQTVEANDTVAVEGRFTGTHTGPLATDDGDVEPTGATVDLRFADVSRVRDGKIVAYHTYYDQLGLLTQLGLMGEAGWHARETAAGRRRRYQQPTISHERVPIERPQRMLAGARVEPGDAAARALPRNSITTRRVARHAPLRLRTPHRRLPASIRASRDDHRPKAVAATPKWMHQPPAPSSSCERSGKQVSCPPRD
jgi:ketosteroid isomerase-like protein